LSLRSLGNESKLYTNNFARLFMGCGGLRCVAPSFAPGKRDRTTLQWELKWNLEMWIDPPNPP